MPSATKDRQFALILGSRVRERRAFHKLTLDQLAKRSSLSKGFLSLVENGLTQPGGASLMNIAKALGVTTDWLLTGEA